MALVLTGKLFTRDSRPYRLDNGNEGTSHKARVGTGRAKFADVTIPDTAEALAAVPPTSAIPEEGLDVAWEVEVAFGKLKYVGPAAAASARAVRSA